MSLVSLWRNEQNVTCMNQEAIQKPKKGKPLSWSRNEHPIAAGEGRDGRQADIRKSKEGNGNLAPAHHYTCQISPLWQLWIV